MIEIKDKHCTPCEGKIKPMGKEKVNEYIRIHIPKWKNVEDKIIEREFTFDKYLQGVDFIHVVAAIADKEDHHPDVCLYYKKVLVRLTTHAIGGLSENDFILATKIDDIDMSSFK